MSAPADPVEYMLQKSGFCFLANRKIPADGREHRIQILRQIRISGRVTDALTGRPIDNLAAIPVLRFHADRIKVQRAQSTKGRAGHFCVVAKRSDVGHAVRVEANGYRTAITNSYLVEQGDQECVVKLQAAPSVRGVVCDAKGNPVCRAKVYLATPSQHLDLYPPAKEWLVSAAERLLARVGPTPPQFLIARKVLRSDTRMSLA